MSFAAKMSFRPGKKPSEPLETPTLSTGKAFSLSTGISAKMSFLKKPNAKSAKPKVKTQTLSFHPKIEKDALPVSVSECNRIIAVNKFDLAAGLEVTPRQMVYCCPTPVHFINISRWATASWLLTASSWWGSGLVEAAVRSAPRSLWRLMWRLAGSSDVGGDARELGRQGPGPLGPTEAHAAGSLSTQAA